MTMEHQFEKASRLKLRFETDIGQLSVEDLWELPLERKGSRLSLDEVAVNLHRQIKAAEETLSFVSNVATSHTYDLLHLRFEIAKHIIQVRVAENAARAQEREKAVKKQQLMEVLSRKQDAALETKSAEEIQAMIDAL
ncbi:hypothetical protein [Ralstonia phage phiRSL1]|uniref:Uncharacterized protein n=1 Tax=Ralstonia phage phiRSL1 TaxID=1980924 RepID=B2ZXS3_9CAUD|nr:hypothetical protein RSL1_ORF058 [Ralstonia phage phiRSL1]BAG41504.1 hypothetical protein [Ralstonia phage phiRSL1]